MMNKAKAYRRLQKKNNGLTEKLAWLESDYRCKPSRAAVLRDRSVAVVEDDGCSGGSSETEEMKEKGAVVRLRYSHPLKPLLSADNVRQAAKEEFLPDIQTCITLMRGGRKTEDTGVKLRPETTGGNEVFRASGGSVTLPSPTKRRASRLYSSSSGSLGFKGRKQPSRDSRRSNSRCIDKESGQAMGGHLPPASKMRQQLEEDGENEPLVQTAALSLTARPTTQNSQQKKNNGSNYFLQHYIYKHQRPLKITTSHNPAARVYENRELENARALQHSLNKQASHAVKSCPVVPDVQKVGFGHAGGAFHPGKLVPLTTKNLELFNSQQNKAQLCLPSSADDDRITKWLDSKQYLMTPTGSYVPSYDAIPETAADGTPES